MEFLSSWLQGIVIAVIITTIIEMILPNSNSKKYVKVVLGVYVVFNIINPIVNKFFNSDFELSAVFNIDEYTEKMKTYEVNTTNINIEESNQENIKNIYTTKLKSDMTAKINEKGYDVDDLQIELDINQEYKIKNIKMVLRKNNNKDVNKQENSEHETNKVIINEIKQVNIQISNNQVQENTYNIEKINLIEKQDIKKYLSSVYDVKETQIEIE